MQKITIMQKIILDYLGNNPQSTVVQLMSVFDLSEIEVGSDLDELAKKGLARSNYDIHKGYIWTAA